MPKQLCTTTDNISSRNQAAALAREAAQYDFFHPASESPALISSSETPGGPIMAHQLPPLPYDYSALEPYIDTQTMKLHHDMHHGTYVKNLNAALEKYPKLQSQAAEDLLRDLNAVPEDIRTTVRNNGGGHVNHTMFWKIMKRSEERRVG